jgi:predicted amidohydrolase YtcJ
MNPMNDGTRVRCRAGAAVAALAAIAVLAAACGGSGSAPATAAQTAYQKTLAYSQCMRAHGEPGFPDPQPNGNLLINGPADHLNGALMNSANKACQHLMPKSKPMTAAQLRQATAQALKFVACMRSHGIAGMADPVVSATGISQRIPNGFSPNSPVFQAAQRACQKLMPGGPP